MLTINTNKSDIHNDLKSTPAQIDLGDGSKRRNAYDNEINHIVSLFVGIIVLMVILVFYGMHVRYENARADLLKALAQQVLLHELESGKFPHDNGDFYLIPAVLELLHAYNPHGFVFRYDRLTGFDFLITEAGKDKRHDLIRVLHFGHSQYSAPQYNGDDLSIVVTPSTSTRMTEFVYLP